VGAGATAVGGQVSQISDFRFQITDFKLEISDFKLKITDLLRVSVVRNLWTAPEQSSNLVPKSEGLAGKESLN
jgi:hypothetical protein